MSKAEQGSSKVAADFMLPHSGATVITPGSMRRKYYVNLPNSIHLYYTY